MEMDLNQVSSVMFNKEFSKLNDKQKESVKVVCDENYMFLKVISKVTFYNDKKNKIKSCQYPTIDEQQSAIKCATVLTEQIINELVNSHNLGKVKPKFVKDIKDGLCYAFYNFEVLTIQSVVGIVEKNSNKFVDFYIKHIFFLI